MTLERLEAIQRSFKVLPPSFEMTTFIGYANGYAKAKKEAEARAVMEAPSSQHHPGGAIVHLFPDGKIA